MPRPTRLEKNMKKVQLTAESSPHAMPMGSRAPTDSENMPLAMSVPPRITAAAAASAARGRLRMTTSWTTMPIQVNWKSSVMATETGSRVSA